MSLKIHIATQPNVLHVVVEGEFDLDEAKRTFVKIVDAVVENRSAKVLFDGRKLSGEPKVIERFYYGEFAASEVLRPIHERKIPRSPQFAYILLHPTLDPERLGETVAVNRGLNVKAFDDLSQGIEWLGLAASDLSNPTS